MKEFAMLTATQRLTQYFLREFSRLDAEVEHQNDLAVQEKRSIRIREVNELSNTLNELFGTLTGSPEAKLFPSYGEHEREVKESGWMHAAKSGDLQKKEKVVSEKMDHENAKQDRLFNSSEANATMSPAQQRVDKILREYEETTPRDIASHLLEHDQPFEVLPGAMLKATDSSENYDLSQTAEGIPFDGDATQITNVETSVEKDGEETNPVTNIVLDEFLIRRSNPLIAGLIDEDLSKLRTR